MSEELKSPKRFQKLNPLSFILYVVIICIVIASLENAGLSPENLQVSERLPVMWSFLQELFPPSLDRLDALGEALIITFQMAIVGTAIGIIFSLPLSFFAAKNFTPNSLIYYIVRWLISLFRTVPDLIWALFFVITVGLGPLAGTLALIIDTIGFCGRFFAESIEEIDEGPTEGLKALGANKLSTIFCAVMPATLPSFTNTSLFSLEKAVRSSVVLGLVGAGGIGIELKVAMDTFRYSQAATIIIAIFLMVLIVERISTYIRGRIM